MGCVSGIPFIYARETMVVGQTYSFAILFDASALNAGQQYVYSILVDARFIVAVCLWHLSVPFSWVCAILVYQFGGTLVRYRDVSLRPLSRLLELTSTLTPPPRLTPHSSPRKSAIFAPALNTTALPGTVTGGNIAETEISALVRISLPGRVQSPDRFRCTLTAAVKRRYLATVTIESQFTNDDGRIKFRRLCPAILD